MLLSGHGRPGAPGASGAPPFAPARQARHALATMAQPAAPDQHNSPIARAFRRLRDHPSRKLRLAAGLALVIGGILGILPVLGFWMLPLGLLLLSVDVPWVRRARRRLAVWWGRKTGRPA